MAKSKKEEKILENIDEPKISEDNNEQKKKKKLETSLKVEIGFTDKYTNEKYEIGKILTNLSKERYEELLKDERKLVSKCG